MSVVVVTPPAAEPLDRATVQRHLRVFDAAEDTYLDDLIATARAHAEAHTRRALITRTLDLVLDAFPGGDGVIDLPLGKVSSVVSVSYVDAAGVTQTVAPADYVIDLGDLPAHVLPAYGKTWPSPRAQASAVRVRFLAGYGAAPADVPPDIRRALLLLCGHWYEHREVVLASNLIPTPLPFAVSALLGPHRVLGFPR